MIYKMLKEIQKEYRCQQVDIGVFRKVKAEGIEIGKGIVRTEWYGNCTFF